MTSVQKTSEVTLELRFLWPVCDL